MISDEQKCIFVHVGRTGGTSVAKIRKFQWHSDLHPHATASDYQKRYPEKWEKYFTFAFVRNPWDRVVSIYARHRKSHRRPARVMPFNEWVEKYSKEGLIKDYITTHDGIVAVDHIGRFEDLSSHFKEICNIIGVGNLKLPHLNRVARPHYTEFYAPSSIKIVAERHRWVIDNFGYRYDA